jgi:hypothetical protein
VEVMRIVHVLYWTAMPVVKHPAGSSLCGSDALFNVLQEEVMDILRRVNDASQEFRVSLE